MPYILEPNFELYEHIVNFLIDRGINRDFVEKLSECATQYHQNSHLETLQDLKSIISNTEKWNN